MTFKCFKGMKNFKDSYIRITYIFGNTILINFNIILNSILFLNVIRIIIFLKTIIIKIIFPSKWSLHTYIILGRKYIIS